MESQIIEFHVLFYYEKMGGVGKTTHLTRINNEFLKTREDEFNAVIWVTMSRPASVEKVEQVLFNKLGILIGLWRDKTLILFVLGEIKL